MIFDYVLFRTPFTCLLAGPTSSGKTELLFKILEEKNRLFDIIPDNIIYCYSEYQNSFNELRNIKFNHGLVDIDDLDNTKNNLLIIDDLMEEATNHKSILHLFTRGYHHKNISVFLIVQNLFTNGKFSRTISLNSHYMFIFKNPRDKSQIQYLGRQMFPKNSNFLVEVYEDISKKPYGYLFIDNKQETSNLLRIKTDILKMNPTVYIEK